MNTKRNSVLILRKTFCPFGKKDLKRVCVIGDKIGVDEKDIFAIICYTDTEEENFDNTNLVSIMLHYITERANRRIQTTIGPSDPQLGKVVTKSWKNIRKYIRSKYDKRSYRHNQAIIDRFKQSIQPHIPQLRDDKTCEFIFKELELV